MNAFAIAKSATSLVAGLGGSWIAANAVRAFSPQTTNVIYKVIITIGGFALTAAVATVAENSARKMFDDIASIVKSNAN